MPGKIRHYESEEIDVQYDLVRCIHAEECVRRVHAVFDSQKRPWIQPQHAPANVIAEAIHHCPSGALHYARKDNGAPEPIPQENRIQMSANGPLYMRGTMTLNYHEAGESQVMNEVRVALCRCGASQHKPFCDNSHRHIDFQADGVVPAEKYKIAEGMNGATGAVSVSTDPNGPLHVEGLLEIVDAAGQIIYRGSDTWLCRCGGSSNKPFCDGTHNHNGFQAE